MIHKKIKRKHKIGLFIFAVIVVGLLLPQKFSMPVEGATTSSYNNETFWYYPWGKSVTHKGVDIFAKKGTPIHSSTVGIVLLASKFGSGNSVLILGPKWRLHYYTHLNEVKIKSFRPVGHNTLIGTVGNTGNAINTPPHLHYSIGTLVPYVWRIDKDRQGWKKAFYLNPINYLETTK